jgi:hypothetical protein
MKRGSLILTLTAALPLTAISVYELASPFTAIAGLPGVCGPNQCSGVSTDGAQICADDGVSLKNYCPGDQTQACDGSGPKWSGCSN